MSTSSSRQPAATLTQATQALRSRQYGQARESFERLVQQEPGNVIHHLGLAYACEALGLAAQAEAAVDGALAADAGDLRALMLKAQLLERQGSERAADYFRAVLKAAEQVGEIPAEFEALVRDAQNAAERHGRELERRLRTRVDELIAQRGAQRSRRFELSLDLLCGRRVHYPSQPRLYSFPELPTVQFFDTAAFPWVKPLEASTDTIRRELLGLLDAGGADRFVPYLQSDPARPQLRRDRLVDNRDWGAFYLWKDGERVAAHADLCPQTMAILESLPLARTPGRSPTVLFSMLQPGAHIQPHHGFINTRLIGHLPLIVPEGCGFRVGNEVRAWREAEVLLFDDTIEHEAWNRGSSPRVVLLFEVWRPELTVDEREAVNAIFEAVVALRRDSGVWGI